MKVHILVILFLALFIKVSAKEYVVINYLGINCVMYHTQKDETFYKVAAQFNVRPSTLALVNDINNIENFLSGMLLYIPLTETNFFRTKGLNTANSSFQPVHFIVESEKKLNEVGDNFYISTTEIQRWNNITVNQVKRGDKLIIGWIKYDTNLEKNQAPTFILKEKIVYGTAAEKAEAKQVLRQVDKSTSKANFPDYSIPENAFPASTPETVEKNATATIAQPRNVNAEISKQRASNLSQNEVIKNASTQIPPSDTVSDNRLTKAEKDFLKNDENKKNKIEKPSNKKGLSLKRLTRNSYDRKKAKRQEELAQNNVSYKAAKKGTKTKTPTQAAKEQVINTVTEKKEVEDKSVSSKPELVDKSNQVVAVTGTTSKNDDPLFVENKLQKLTLLKSTNGQASFFYSGTAGAKFYVFTNLANKGGIIKITNLSNGNYLLAEVIGSLPEVDRVRGVLLKISDNSKLILNVKGNSFVSKVNY